MRASKVVYIDWITRPGGSLWARESGSWEVCEYSRIIHRSDVATWHDAIELAALVAARHGFEEIRFKKSVSTFLNRKAWEKEGVKRSRKKAPVKRVWREVAKGWAVGPEGGPGGIQLVGGNETRCVPFMPCKLMKLSEGLGEGQE